MADDEKEETTATKTNDPRLPALAAELAKVKEDEENLVDLLDKLRAYIAPPRRLTALEQDLYRVPDIALGAVLDALVADDSDEHARYAGADDKFERVRVLAALAEQSVTLKRALLGVAYSSKSSVQEVSSTRTLAKDVVLEGLRRARGIDLATADGLDIATKTPTPSHVQDLPTGDYVIVYVWSNNRARPVVMPDGTLSAPMKRTQVALVIDPKEGRVQARGAAGDLETAISQFQHDLQTAGLAACSP